MSPVLATIFTTAAPLLTPPALEAPTDDHLPGEVRIGDTAYPYLLLPPAEVVEGESYPLILFLHGAGERGDDNELQKRHFPERMASEAYRERFPCYVLAPQCPSERRWVEVDWSAPGSTPLTETPTEPMQAAIAALEEVVRQHPIDLDRIALSGLSMGGYGTWDLATRHPGWFSAAAPICGGGDERQAARLAGLPLSVWHGDADGIVLPVRSRTMVDAVRALGLEVQYEELPGVGHDSWNQAYGEEGCVGWLLEAKRDPSRILGESARLFAKSVAPTERVAFLGDSITQAGNSRGGYVDLLRNALIAEHPEAVVIPAGISGHKVPDLLRRYQKDVLEQKATLVFLYIGINDVWHWDWGKGSTPEEFESGLRTLVRDFRASGAEVVLATPTVIGEKAAGENSKDAKLDEYAALSRKVAAEEGATMCDLRRAFQDHLRLFNRAGAEKGVLTSDTVHLNPAGNVLVATEAARALRRAAIARE